MNRFRNGVSPNGGRDTIAYGGVAERLNAPDLHSGEPGRGPSHPGSVGPNPTTSALSFGPFHKGRRYGLPAPLHKEPPY